MDDSAVIAAMAYVNLNPLRARIVQDIDEYRAASGYERVMVARYIPDRLEKAIEPLVSGLTKERSKASIILGHYLDILESVQADYRTTQSEDKKSR